MNEITFAKFGEALDLLEEVYFATKGEDEKIIQNHLHDLQGFYEDVKAEYGYKNNSDK